MQHVLLPTVNRSEKSITADLRSQKGPLPKCCPPMSNVTKLVSDVTKNVQRCPKDGVEEQVRTLSRTGPKSRISSASVTQMQDLGEVRVSQLDERGLPQAHSRL